MSALPKFNDAQKLLIKSWVDEDATINLKALRLKIIEECGVTVSISTVNNCLNEFHYSLKTLTIFPQRRNCDQTLSQRLTYIQNFNSRRLETEDKNFVFIDEVGFSVSCRTRCGRSLTGMSAYAPVTSVRSRNISVIDSMRERGMIYYQINHKPVNGEDFKSYLLELRGQCCSLGIENPCFILDNARIHHYHGLHDAARSL